MSRFWGISFPNISSYNAAKASIRKAGLIQDNSWVAEVTEENVVLEPASKVIKLAESSDPATNATESPVGTKLVSFESSKPFVPIEPTEPSGPIEPSLVDEEDVKDNPIAEGKPSRLLESKDQDRVEMIDNLNNLGWKKYDYKIPAFNAHGRLIDITLSCNDPTSSL